jgi:hypothetical protein
VTFVVLFILAVVWAVYLVSWARSRSEHRSVNSISTFSKHLSVLERTAPGRSSAPTRLAGSPAPQRAAVSLARPAFAPHPYRASGTGGAAMSRRQVRERRKNVLFALAGAVLVTLALTVLLGGATIYLQLLADVLLGAYVLMLIQTQRMVAERQSKVRYMPQPVEYHVPAAHMLQSSAR